MGLGFFSLFMFFPSPLKLFLPRHHSFDLFNCCFLLLAGNKSDQGAGAQPLPPASPPEQK